MEEMQFNQHINGMRYTIVQEKIKPKANVFEFQHPRLSPRNHHPDV